MILEFGSLFNRCVDLISLLLANSGLPARGLEWQEFWDLEFEIYLELGTCDLELIIVDPRIREDDGCGWNDRVGLFFCFRFFFVNIDRIVIV